MGLEREEMGGLEEGGGLGGHQTQSLQEVAESSGHFARLLQQDQTTGGGDLCGGQTLQSGVYPSLSSHLPD